MNYNDKVYTKMPGYDKHAIREAFHKAIPLKTLVIMCADPRASGIPDAVAREFGQTPWPGTLTFDADGRKIGSTTQVAVQVTAGGRAQDALRSITTYNHLLGLENVVVVHHTYCGGTAVKPEDLIEAYKAEEGGNIAQIHDPRTIAISNFDDSLRYDVYLIRNAPGTPKHLNIFGYVYDIDDETLTKVIEDRGKQDQQ